jgi:hypothetical protein
LLIFFLKKKSRKSKRKKREREREKYSGGDKCEKLLFLCGIKVKKKRNNKEKKLMCPSYHTKSSVKKVDILSN